MGGGLMTAEGVLPPAPIPAPEVTVAFGGVPSRF